MKNAAEQLYSRSGLKFVSFSDSVIKKCHKAWVDDAIKQNQEPHPVCTELIKKIIAGFTEISLFFLLKSRLTNKQVSTSVSPKTTDWITRKKANAVYETRISKPANIQFDLKVIRIVD